MNPSPEALFQQFVSAGEARTSTIRKKQSSSETPREKPVGSRLDGDEI
jgi:hypothetical protein